MNAAALLTEDRFSNWRVIATDKEGNEHLIFTGKSYTHVTEAFPDAFDGLLDVEEKSKITSVTVQKWNGTASMGDWKNKKSLQIP